MKWETGLYIVLVAPIIIMLPFLLVSPHPDSYIIVGDPVKILFGETWNGFTYQGLDAGGYGIIVYKDTRPFHVDHDDKITINKTITYRIMDYGPEFCKLVEVTIK